MRRTRRAILAGLASFPVLARPAVAAHTNVWARWQANDPASSVIVDHGLWGQFLSRYVHTGGDGINRVAYGAVTAEDRALLRHYVGQLGSVQVSLLRRPEQFAFWSNLYNALTVDVVLQHYPVSSIRDIDISPGMFAVGPWGAKLATVEGEPISLDDIENRILRPIWRDACVHYALNCASIGCPNLQKAPFSTDLLTRHLDGAARAYVNDPRGVTLGPDGLVVSSIYVWYQADFGGTDNGVIRHLMTFAEPNLAMRLQDVGTITGNRYDWRLNDAG